MFLLFIRHAIAAPLEGLVARDEDRPLTGRGKKRFRQVARPLSRLVPKPSAILTSPLLRARQTADLVAQALGGPTPIAVPALRDGNWSEVGPALSSYGKKDYVAVIGHEDWISSITGRLLGSESRSAFGYRKGGVALLEVPNLDDCNATLLWFIPPHVFRRL